MTKAGLLGVGSLALCVLLAASAPLGATAAEEPAGRAVAPRSDTGGTLRVADLFGESDEEKAARLQKEQNQDDAIGRLNDKVRDLEDTIRNLTGENETLTHRVQELDDKLERQRKDFEYRLCAMSAQQLGAGTAQGDPNAIPCPGAGGATAASPPPAQGDTASGTAAPQRLAPGPGILGTLPGGGTGGTGSSVIPPASGTQAEFSAAMNLLAKGRNDEASAAFRGFADTHPKDDLAPQAIYWVGDIAYVEKDYGNATRAFAEVIKKYPTSARAPDSMLKLGQALIASGQKKEGCTALAALPAKYPHASQTVLAQGSEARRGTCR